MAERVDRLVLDLSHHNTVADWNAVQAAGIVGIIHKATESTNYVDQSYNATRQQVTRRGLLWGAYHFLRPGNMKDQAQYFVQHAGVGHGGLLAADHEDSRVSLADLQVFMEEVTRLSGQRPILYSGNVIKEQVGLSNVPWLKPYRLWLAHYSSQPKWPTQIWPKYWLWQYGDGNMGPSPAGCPGVTGDVDTNSALDANELIRTWGGVREPVPMQVVEVLVRVPRGIEVVVKTEVTGDNNG